MTWKGNQWNESVEISWDFWYMNVKLKTAFTQEDIWKLRLLLRANLKKIQIYGQLHSWDMVQGYFIWQKEGLQILIRRERKLLTWLQGCIKLDNNRLYLSRRKVCKGPITFEDSVRKIVLKSAWRTQQNLS